MTRSDWTGATPCHTFGRQNRPKPGVAPAQTRVFVRGLFSALPSRIYFAHQGLARVCGWTQRTYSGENAANTPVFTLSPSWTGIWTGCWTGTFSPRSAEKAIWSSVVQGRRF